MKPPLVLALMGAVLAAMAPGAARGATAAPFTSEQAVALALQRNRDAIAARLEIDVAKVDQIAARLYPNPVFSVGISNLVLGKANPQGRTPPVSAGFFGQTVSTFGVTQVVDVWGKRRARMNLADRTVEQRRLEVEDVLRQIGYAVRGAFADLVREQQELALAREIHARHQETVRLSRRRHEAGEISAADLNKIELEGMKYQNDVIDAEMEHDLARQKLAALLGLEATADLPPAVDDGPPDRVPALAQLVAQALLRRPDLRAAAAGRVKADYALRAARREAFPDIALGLAFTHDEFTASGDNANFMALSISLPLPLFDRGQGSIARARVDIRKAENETARLALVVQREVADAVRQATRARTLVGLFEGGMLRRAETALRVTERSWKVGAVSLLELLEAQRSYIEVRAQYLKAKSDYRQALNAVAFAVGGRIE